MPVAFRSRPSVARTSASVSTASKEENAREDSLSVVARERREVVKAAWVWEADSRRGSVGDTEGSS